MQILVGDEVGYLKTLNAQTGQVVKKLEPKDKNSSIIRLRVFKNLLFSIDKSNRLLVLDYQLEEINSRIITLCPSLPTNMHLNCSDKIVQLIFSFKNGIVGSIEYDINTNEFNNEVLISNVTGKLNASQYQDGKLLLLWSQQPPSILNINSHELIWKARNVKNDMYDLKVPMDDADGIFADDYTIIVVTLRKQKIRFYDITKDKSQPIQEYDISKYSNFPLKHIQISSCNKLLFIGNLKGEVLVFDKNNKMILVGKLQGTQGSIRDLQFDSQKTYIASVCIDRYLRVYDARTFKLVQQHNVNQRLSSLVFLEQQPEELIEVQKVQQSWTVHTGKQARDRFKYMRKHTIKLSYLGKMFENQKTKFQKMRQQDEKQRVLNETQQLIQNEPEPIKKQKQQ